MCMGTRHDTSMKFGTGSGWSRGEESVLDFELLRVGLWREIEVERGKKGERRKGVGRKVE